MANVRPYKTPDYLEISEMLKKEDMFDPIWNNEKNFTSMIESDSEAILVAEKDGKVVGCIILDPHGSEAVFFYRFAVAEEYRNQGIGSALFEYAEQLAKKRGYKEIAFYVSSENERLQNYYKRKGYQTSDRKLVCMFKSLK